MSKLKIMGVMVVIAFAMGIVLVGDGGAQKRVNAENKLVRVKAYHLAGDGIEIEFSMKDPKALELVYRDKQGERKFSGQAIRLVENRELGFLASVVLEQVPDLRIITFSLAVPSANRNNDEKSISVETFAVRTTTRTSSGGPRLVKGQIQAYQIPVLKGNAW